MFQSWLRPVLAGELFFVVLRRAILIRRGMAVWAETFGAGLAVGRFSALKSWFSELNRPGRPLDLSFYGLVAFVGMAAKPGKDLG
jgi:hypothetical protein